MPRAIILDTFPLSNTARREPSPGAAPTAGEQCHKWIGDCIQVGHLVIAPAICFYEVLREMERLGAQGQIRRLRHFCFSDPVRFLSITDRHLEAAARLWAQARRDGVPTASPESLDVDVILAAQAQTLAHDLGLDAGGTVVATTNVGHLARFVPAEHWAQIAPGS